MFIHSLSAVSAVWTSYFNSYASQLPAERRILCVLALVQARVQQQDLHSITHDELKEIGVSKWRVRKDILTAAATAHRDHGRQQQQQQQQVASAAQLQRNSGSSAAADAVNGDVADVDAQSLQQQTGHQEKAATRIQVFDLSDIFSVCFFCLCRVCIVAIVFASRAQHVVQAVHAPTRMTIIM